mmetsp:Transcript_26040/g.53519  ORF Transcript_26040/g.53519 Transcript_26040/m.53519 type:complete len:318 (-) Transcript_26040:1351-2304(-)
MPMPSASLTLGDKVLIRIVSGTFFAVSSFWCGHERIRSVGIACFPLGFALFCKCTRPFASPETRAKLAEEHRERETNKKKNSQQIDFFEDPLDDPSFSQKSLVWSVIQIVCAVSGLFDWYPSVVVKSALVFHILLTVQDSIETRPMALRREELRRKRNEKLRLESALFWKFFLPAFFWKWMGYKTIVDAATKSSASSKNGSSSSKNNDPNDSPPKMQEKLLEKVKVTKNVATGQRETAVEDLIWGAVQIAHVVFDLTHKQAIGTAFLVYLCTLLEDVLLSTAVSIERNNKNERKKINWFNVSWILLCLYLNARWFLS